MFYSCRRSLGEEGLGRVRTTSKHGGVQERRDMLNFITYSGTRWSGQLDREARQSHRAESSAVSSWQS